MSLPGAGGVGGGGKPLLAPSARRALSLAEQRSDLASGLSSIRGSQPVENVDEKDEDYWADIDVTKLRVRELRAALSARGLSTGGKKKALQLRLQQSVHEEKEEELEYLALVEAARRAEAALEESGSVYSCGLNRKGQLGLGDRVDRAEFTVIPELRGKGVMQVCAGGDQAMALSESGNVFTWGGISTGQAPPKDATRLPALLSPAARNPGSKKNAALEAVPVSPLAVAGEDGVCRPQLLERLQGEGVIYIATGPNHSAAVSDSGDCYLWGDGTRGQLGTGRFAIETAPRLVETLKDGAVVTQLAVGQTHSMLLTEEAEVLTCGFSNSGKLGLGVSERKGVKPPLNKYFPEPTAVASLAQARVRLVACSANHSACVAEQGVLTWGSGDGGRLGHGDHRDRLEPTLVEDLKGQVVIDLSLGFWHSAAIVQIPPVFQGGSLVCWGSAYHGQLAQSDVTCLLRPTVSQVCLDMRLLFVRLACGPTHCLAQTVDGDLYSWGSNQHGELGRAMAYQEDEERHYTPIPGVIKGFNTIVNRVGRGNVVSFCCGKEFTIVATAKYQGETEEELKIRGQGELAARQHQQALKEALASAKGPVEATEPVNLAEYNDRGCDGCEACPGFIANLFRPTECKECGHRRTLHNKPNKQRAQLRA
jgi:alpha-tubulin suppressor-like RCC1 family protein